MIKLITNIVNNDPGALERFVQHGAVTAEQVRDALYNPEARGDMLRVILWGLIRYGQIGWVLTELERRGWNYDIRNPQFTRRTADKIDIEGILRD